MRGSSGARQNYLLLPIMKGSAMAAGWLTQPCVASWITKHKAWLLIRHVSPFATMNWIREQPRKEYCSWGEKGMGEIGFQTHDYRKGVYRNIFLWFHNVGIPNPPKRRRCSIASCYWGLSGWTYRGRAPYTASIQKIKYKFNTTDIKYMCLELFSDSTSSPIELACNPIGRIQLVSRFRTNEFKRPDNHLILRSRLRSH